MRPGKRTKNYLQGAHFITPLPSPPLNHTSVSIVLKPLKLMSCFPSTILSHMGLGIEAELFHLWWTQKPHWILDQCLLPGTTDIMCSVTMVTQVPWALLGSFPATVHSPWRRTPGKNGNGFLKLQDRTVYHRSENKRVHNDTGPDNHFHSSWGDRVQTLWMLNPQWGRAVSPLCSLAHHHPNHLPTDTLLVTSADLVASGLATEHIASLMSICYL